MDPRDSDNELYPLQDLASEGEDGVKANNGISNPLQDLEGVEVGVEIRSPHNLGSEKCEDAVALKVPGVTMSKEKLVDVVGLSVVIVTVGVLLTLPIIFFHLPMDESVSPQTGFRFHTLTL